MPLRTGAVTAWHIAFTVWFLQTANKATSEKHAERGEGDVARTGDSLLGGQCVTKSPLTCYELALLAHIDDMAYRCIPDEKVRCAIYLRLSLLFFSTLARKTVFPF